MPLGALARLDALALTENRPIQVPREALVHLGKRATLAKRATRDKKATLGKKATPVRRVMRKMDWTVPQVPLDPRERLETPVPPDPQAPLDPQEGLETQGRKATLGKRATQDKKATLAKKETQVRLVMRKME